LGVISQQGSATRRLVCRVYRVARRNYRV